MNTQHGGEGQSLYRMKSFGMYCGNKKKKKERLTCNAERQKQSEYRPATSIIPEEFLV